MTVFIFFLGHRHSLATYENFLNDAFNQKTENFSIKNNSIMFEQTNLPSAPIIENDLSDEMNTFFVDVNLLDYSKNANNFLVFYDTSHQATKEIHRIKLTKSGRQNLFHKNLIDKFSNNRKIKIRLESYSNNLDNLQYSKFSDTYYTNKDFDLEIYEDDKPVYLDKYVIGSNKIKQDEIKLETSDLRQYLTNKYYQYENAEILIDNQASLKQNQITLDYFTKKIRLNLSKVKDQWVNLSLKYPSALSEYQKTISLKKSTNFSEVRKEYASLFTQKPFKDYTFLGYFIEDTPIANYNNNINIDTEIVAKYSTKITILKDNVAYTDYLTTGEDLSTLNLDNYQKENYHIKSFIIKDSASNQEKKVDSLAGIKVDNAITIEPIYEENTINITIRQDDYNKRFGSVDKSLALDIKWPVTKPLSFLFDDISQKIKANDGYTLEFRTNREVIDPNTTINEDRFIEIYFKKIEEKWVKVRFIGDGIDKFLSDGQDVLAGQKIDTINLPTSQVANHNFVGWVANYNYKLDINNNIITKAKDDIIKTNDLHNVITSPKENIIFTAIYKKNYQISIASNLQGLVILPNDEDNIIEVKENSKIADSIDSKKLHLLPNAHFRFSHFTSTLPVLVNYGNGQIKIIKAGDKISIKDFYHIVVTSNLTFTANFVLYNGILDNFNTYFDKDTNDILNTSLEKNYNMTLEKALGPLTFLK